MRHIADDCLSALVHRDVLDPDGLIASAPVSLERLHLRREGPGELIEGALCTILLLNGFHMRKPTRECHGRRVNGGHLSREHGLHLIRRF
jgi:hypothetical protein